MILLALLIMILLTTAPPGSDLPWACWLWALAPVICVFTPTDKSDQRSNPEQ